MPHSRERQYLAFGKGACLAAENNFLFPPRFQWLLVQFCVLVTRHCLTHCTGLVRTVSSIFIRHLQLSGVKLG